LDSYQLSHSFPYFIYTVKKLKIGWPLRPANAPPKLIDTHEQARGMWDILAYGLINKFKV